jgi:hypothetical protein
MYTNMCFLTFLCKALKKLQKLLQIQTHRIGIKIQIRVRVLTVKSEKI